VSKLIAHSSRDGSVGPATQKWLNGEPVPTQHWGRNSKWVDFIGRDCVLCLIIVLGVLSLVCYLR
jgi:hypothetical protein